MKGLILGKLVSTEIKNKPQVFLNYLLFDQYNNLIPAACGAIQAYNTTQWQTLQTDDIIIPQNGFIRVFTSNQSTAPVEINNTTLTITKGHLIEEYNYYPFGLVFDNTTTIGIKQTNFLFNAKELQQNEFGNNNGIELTDFINRTYDQQTGRFLQPDLLSQLRSGISPFNYCQNNPINRVDPTGNLDTDYKDENGNLIKHTDDKINRTVTVKNEDRSRFDIYTKTGEDKGIINNKNYNDWMTSKLQGQEKNDLKRESIGSFEGLNQDKMDFAGAVGGGLTTVFGAASHYSDMVKTAGKIGVVGNVITGTTYGHALVTGQAQPAHHLDAAVAGTLLIMSLNPATAPFAITAGFIYGGARLIGGEAFDSWFNSQFTPTPVLTPNRIKP